MLASSTIKDASEVNSGDPILDQVVIDVINNDPTGLDGPLNPGFSSEVKGLAALMSSSFDLNAIDANDPALLLIIHENARDGGGNSLIGSWTGSWADGHVFASYSTNPIFEKASSVGISNGLKKFNGILYSMLTQD